MELANDWPTKWRKIGRNPKWLFFGASWTDRSDPSNWTIWLNNITKSHKSPNFWPCAVFLFGVGFIYKMIHQFQYHPWDERYICLHEWLILFMGFHVSKYNIPYIDPMGQLMVQKSGDHHLGCINLVNNGINYQTQQVQDFFHQQNQIKPLIDT